MSFDVAKFEKYAPYALLFLAPFSKQPSIALPFRGFVSFRIGLYQTLVALFVGVILVRNWSKIRKSLNVPKYLIYSLAILVGAAIGGFIDSYDKPRSGLMVVSFVFLLLVVFSGWVWARLYGVSRKLLAKFAIWSGLVYGAISVIQLIVTTVSSSKILLCSGCGDAVFGFPRVNGFSAEPLFWANSLLLVVLVCLVVVDMRDKYAKLALFGGTLAITLTFARGAYVALGMCVVAFLLHVIVRERSKLPRLGISAAVMGTAVIAGFGLLVASATYRHREDRGIAYRTIQGMVEHMTLGAVRLPDPETTSPSPAQLPSGEVEFEPAGLVEASTNDRINSAKLALRAWTSNVRILLFGTGFGNLGPYIVRNIDTSAPSNLTVYIFYVLFLAEAGIVSLITLVYLYLRAIKSLVGTNKELHIAIALVLVAYLFQYLFFGSYINVVYIWLLLGIGLGLPSTLASKNSQK